MNSENAFKNRCLRLVLTGLFVFITSVVSATEPPRGVKEDYPISKLDLRVVSTDSISNVAIVEQVQNNQQSIFEKGDSVFGAARLVRINKDSIVIRNNGRLEVVLKTRGLVDLTPRQVEQEASPIQYYQNEVASAIDLDAPESQAQIEGIDTGNEILLTRADLDRVWNDVPRQLLSALPTPVFRDWEVVGISLNSVESGSLLDAVGLSDGDILKTIDGVRITDPMAAWNHINNIDGSEVKLNVERGGQDVELVIRIS